MGMPQSEVQVAIDLSADNGKGRRTSRSVGGTPEPKG